MGTARTSPQVVRERRRKGIQPKRGDAKAWNPQGDALQDAVVRLLAGFNIPPTVKEDVTQEVWIKLIEGEKESQIRESLPALIRGASDIEYGPWMAYRLDAPAHDRHGQEFGSIGDLLDTEGILRTHRPFTPKGKWGGRRNRLTTEEKERRFQVRAAWLAERNARRLIREKRRMERRLVLLAWYDRYLVGHGSFIGMEHWAERIRNGDPVHGRLGTQHREETKSKMSASRRALWAGSYGHERRQRLGVAEMVCRKCGYDGPLEGFAKNRNCYGGRDKICKPCMSAQTQEMKRRRRQRLLESVE